MTFTLVWFLRCDAQTIIPKFNSVSRILEAVFRCHLCRVISPHVCCKPLNLGLNYGSCEYYTNNSEPILLNWAGHFASLPDEMVMHSIKSPSFSFHL